MLKKTYVFPWLITFLVLYFVIPPTVRSMFWKEDELRLFDLANEMEQINQNFYKRLGVEIDASIKEINKAYRQLVVKQHPDTSDNKEFHTNNEIAYVLRTPKLKTLYDSILTVDGRHRIPFWKGFYYLYTRHKIPCMMLVSIFSICLLEYVKAWNSYWSERVVIEQFIKNAKTMAQKISDKHLLAATHKSFMDLGDRTVRCEITSQREIWIVDEKGRVPLDVSNLLEKPTVSSLSIPKSLLRLFKRLN